MNIEQLISKAFRMDESTWQRHANPWSVYTRMATLPLLIMAVWSRAWWGWWALVPILLVLLWIWLNPRLFPPPQSTDNWASKAVLGERVWLNRKAVPVPKHHQILPNILSTIAALGGVVMIYGLVKLEIYPTLLGAVVAFLAKLWFVDRMVWLYDDMSATHETYRSWLY